MTEEMGTPSGHDVLDREQPRRRLIPPGERLLRAIDEAHSFTRARDRPWVYLGWLFPEGVETFTIACLCHRQGTLNLYNPSAMDVPYVKLCHVCMTRRVYMLVRDRAIWFWVGQCSGCERMFWGLFGQTIGVKV